LIPARNMVIIVFGLVLICLGFYFLARGSITLAPFLLVAGYCAVIPLGIIMGAPGGRRGAQRVRREGE